MHLHIKICGLRRLADTEAVNRYRPDYTGFVFAKSSRQVDRETARDLKARLAAEIPVLGVFVNSPPDQVAALANEGIIDGIQLHGDEDEQYLQALRQLTRAPLFKAIRLRADSAAELARCGRYVDYIVLDAFQPGVYGGTGRKIDKDLLQGLRLDPAPIDVQRPPGGAQPLVRLLDDDRAAIPQRADPEDVVDVAVADLRTGGLLIRVEPVKNLCRIALDVIRLHEEKFAECRHGSKDSLLIADRNGQARLLPSLFNPGRISRVFENDG